MRQDIAHEAVADGDDPVEVAVAVVYLAGTHVMIQRLDAAAREAARRLAAARLPQGREAAQCLLDEDVEPAAGNVGRGGHLADVGKGVGTCPVGIAPGMVDPVAPEGPGLEAEFCVEFAQRQHRANLARRCLEFHLAAAGQHAEGPEDTQRVAVGAAVVVAAVDIERGVVRRQPLHAGVAHARRLPLCRAGVGFAVGDQIAVEPGLFREPVEEILGIVALLAPQVGLALRESRTAAVLDDHAQALAGKLQRILGTRGAAAIGGADDDDRMTSCWGWQVDVRGEAHAIAQRHHDAADAGDAIGCLIFHGFGHGGMMGNPAVTINGKGGAAVGMGQGLHFVASFVGNFGAYVESAVIFFLTEARRHRGAGNRNREFTRIHTKKE